MMTTITYVAEFHGGAQNTDFVQCFLTLIFCLGWRLGRSCTGMGGRNVDTQRRATRDLPRKTWVFRTYFYLRPYLS